MISSELAPAPDFWGIAVGVALGAILLVVLSGLGDWFYVPGTFVAFASVFFWWTATGLDYWAANGGGTANTVAALGDPATAGTGAFGGVLSTPYGWVGLNVLVTMLIGVGLGMLSTRLAGAMTPKKQPEAATSEPISGHEGRGGRETVAS